jgi:hypothetical protein
LESTAALTRPGQRTSRLLREGQTTARTVAADHPVGPPPASAPGADVRAVPEPVEDVRLPVERIELPDGAIGVDGYTSWPSSPCHCLLQASVADLAAAGVPPLRLVRAERLDRVRGDLAVTVACADPTPDLEDTIGLGPSVDESHSALGASVRRSAAAELRPARCCGRHEQPDWRPARACPDERGEHRPLQGETASPSAGTEPSPSRRQAVTREGRRGRARGAAVPRRPARADRGPDAEVPRGQTPRYRHS